MEELRPGARLEGPFWPEPVEILRVEPHGELWRVFAVGLSSGRYHGERWLGPEDLRQIRILPPASPGLRGDPQAVFLGLEAHRIRLAYQFDPLHALHISMIDPLPHQIDAVYFHMLPKARLRFLLADDPGAGKTIMAGLLLKELKHRGAVERVLIVVPGHLRDQWIRELKEKFGETFLVVDRHTLNSTYGRNPWREGLQFITSMDFAKQEEILATLSDVEWDLVIVDEAHKLSAWRFGDRTKKTQRYRLGEVLARNSRLLLFLTATPHRGDPENFRLLLSLLDPDLFAKAEHLEEAVRRGENPLVLRRLKEDLRTIDGVPLFPPRYVHTVLFRLSPEEMAFYEALTRYVRDEFNRALDAERRNVQFALMLLQRRLASSLYAARRSLERRKERLQKLLERGELLRERGEVDEEELEDLPEAERWKREEELLEKLTAARTLEELREEIRRLEELIVLGRDLERAGVETKLRELKKLLSELGRTHPDEKLVVFTESRDSLEYLAKNVRQWGYEVTVLHGGMNLEERIRAEAEFRDRAQILISTEAGGEGINLQFASLMVNYDIPWNPNRLEQRMGRIHRYGQRHEVHIYNLVAENTVEGEVLRRLFQKLQRIREALGSDRVFDVIQEVLRGRSLADLILEALSGRRSLAEIVAEIEAMPDPEAIERIRQATAEALATRHIDLSRILGEERRAKENRLVPEYVEEFFRRATEFLGIRLSRNEEGLWRVGLVPAFLRQRSADFRARFGEVRDTYRRLTFYKDEAWKKGAEYTGPGHPLFEAVLEEILVRTTADREEGAVFLDPNRKLLGTIFFVEASIEDGNGETAGKRLFAALFPPDGEPSPIHPAILYDLLPGRGTVPFDPPDPERVRAFVARELVPKFLSELTGERKRQAEIRRRYGLRSLDSRIAEAVETILDLESRRARGEEIPQVAIDQAHRRREELEERRKTFAERIKREEILLPGEIKILGVVAVLPVPESPEEPTPDPALEKIGMEEAMAYERRNGREPVDVSRENLGYDIRSEGPGEVRYIEVKTRAKPGPVLLTQNEWLMAHRLGAEYWLYVVTVEEGPRLWLIRNPAELPAEKKTVVQYALDWRNWAEPAEG
ncbi:MAG: helicase-related protein [Candidatus Bipolaricaulaceae bacterium]